METTAAKIKAYLKAREKETTTIYLDYAKKANDLQEYERVKAWSKKNRENIAKINESTLKAFCKKSGIKSPKYIFTALKNFSIYFMAGNQSLRIGDRMNRAFECGGNPEFLGAQFNYKTLQELAQITR